MSANEKNVIEVVTGILKNDQNEILIAQRPKNKPKGGYWEFPGGKIELGENAFSALKREFFEEIGVEISSANHLANFSYHYEKESLQINLQVWLIEKYTGVPYGKEGQVIQFIKNNQLHEFNFLEANNPILDHLKYGKF